MDLRKDNMRIKTEPPEMCLAVICIQEGCRWERVCANHETAGDFRSEGGSRPILALRNGEVHCETFHSPGDGYEPHELPTKTAAYDYHRNAIVCWRDLDEEVDRYEI